MGAEVDAAEDEGTEVAGTDEGTTLVDGEDESSQENTAGPAASG